MSIKYVEALNDIYSLFKRKKRTMEFLILVLDLTFILRELVYFILTRRKKANQLFQRAKVKES